MGSLSVESSAHAGAAAEGAVSARCEVLDLGSRGVIATGICFLDHMVDQFTAHGQLGISLRVSLDGRDVAPDQDYCGATAPGAERPHDAAIFAACGQAVGTALRSLTREAAAATPKARFNVPLDEALADVRIDLAPATPGLDFGLPPYGIMPKGGRVWIGRFRTALLEVFWQRLANSLGAHLTLNKLRGDNAHHIVESTFKSFARALRAGMDAAQFGAQGVPAVPVDSASARTASHSRSTKETSIEVSVNLDSDKGAESTFATGLPLLDRILGELGSASGFGLSVSCRGDRYIDDHHTAEDVSIALGQCLNRALGDKKGLNRMGFAEHSSGDAAVLVVIDLSNRPHFGCDLELDEEFVGGESAASEPAGQSECSALSCEMLFHFFNSLTVETRATVHVVQRQRAESAGFTLDLALATARAYGSALKTCAAVDPRRMGGVASSKGTLSA